MREHNVQKLSTPPVVQDATHPDHTTDPHGAEGGLVALAGAPVAGGVPTYSASTQQHTSQVPGALGGMVPTYIGPGETFTVPEHRQALYALPIDNEGNLDVAGHLVMVD